MCVAQIRPVLTLPVAVTELLTRRLVRMNSTAAGIRITASAGSHVSLAALCYFQARRIILVPGAAT